MCRLPPAVAILLAATMSLAHAAPVAVSGTATAFDGPEFSQGGYPYPQGTYRSFDTSNDVAFGVAATVSSTIPGFGPIHSAAFLTDGNYGNGRSWIPATGSATITMNLGSAFGLSEIKFGRDRLGYFNDRAPSGIMLELAGSNGIYQTVLNQSLAGLTAATGYTISIVNFDWALTQYVRMTLSSVSSAFGIDEIEIYAAPAPGSVALIGLGLIALALFRRRGEAS